MFFDKTTDEPPPFCFLDNKRSASHAPLYARLKKRSNKSSNLQLFPLLEHACATLILLTLQIIL